MPTRGYTFIGWVVWQVAMLVARRKLGKRSIKLGAAATVVAVLLGGLAAAKATTSDDC